MTTRGQPAAWSRAASRSSVTSTPLPAARPSSLTTYGGPKSSRAAAASSGVPATWDRPVGTPAAAITSLANALLPSIRAAAADGPKQAMPAAVTASATPATSGASGPMTTRLTPSCCASAVTDGGVGRVDRVVVGQQCGARVARRGVHRLHLRIAGQGQHQRVLAAARADHQDPQGFRHGRRV